MKIFFKILSWCMMIIFVSLAVCLVGIRAFGYTPYSVISGSMEPAYRTGSLVFVKNVPYQSIKTGDAISFVLDKNLTVATHRVIDISDDGEYFYTKGDANSSPDPSPVYYKNIIGKATFSIQWLGYFAMWISSTTVKICIASVIFILLVVSMLRTIYKYKGKSSAEKTSAIDSKVQI